MNAERTVPSCTVSRTRLSAERTVAAVRLASADSNDDRGCRGAPNVAGNARSPRTLVPSVASPTCLALVRDYAVLRRLLARREFPSGSPCERVPVASLRLEVRFEAADTESVVGTRCEILVSRTSCDRRDHPCGSHAVNFHSLVRRVAPEKQFSVSSS